MTSILLLAYQISPTRGSEYAVGWNFTINLAKNNKVYVLCGASGDHMGDTFEIENYINENPHPNIHLITITPSKLANSINFLNKKGFTPAFYIAYNMWHKQAYLKARELIQNKSIDLIHHLNPIGFREPGYLWKIDKPFVWGPVGGAKFINLSMLKDFPFKYKVTFSLKNFINYLQLNFSPRVHRAADKASEIVFCNSEMKISFETYLNKTGKVISEQGSSVSNQPINSTYRVDHKKFNIGWAGNIRYVKNIPLLLTILSSLEKQEGWTLHLVGGGENIEQVEALALKLGIYKNITWHGRKQRDETIDILSQCDLHIITSISEGNPAVLYEAISFGVPTISLDQDGMHDTLANGNGILIPVTTYENTAKEFALQIDKLINNPSQLDDLKKRTLLIKDKFTWEKKIQQFEVIYKNAIDSYSNKS